MPNDPLQQLVYTSVYSAARIENGLKALREILAVSKRNNAAHGITGYLIFDGETFIQVLEGPRSAVEATYERIARDVRHRESRILGVKQTTERCFEAWAMAGYLRGPREAGIFLRHGVDGPLAQADLTAQSALALMQELAEAQTTPVT